MINRDGSRDPHYDMIKSINADVLAVGAELVKAKSVAVIREAKDVNDAAIAPTGPGQFTIGVFERGDGKHLALVTNRDYKQPIKSQVTVKPATAKVEQFDPRTKSWSAARMPDKGEGDVIVELPAGGGVLLRW
jgi:hypothetical protein